jgi:hypothetical protein
VCGKRNQRRTETSLGGGAVVSSFCCRVPSTSPGRSSHRNSVNVGMVKINRLKTEQ